jgi:actin-related protein
LTLYSSGRSTGTVLESGGAVTHAVSVYEGHLIQDSSVRLDLGGNDVDLYLKKLMQENSHLSISDPSLTEVEMNELVRNVKESFGSHTLIPEEKKFELPDGRSIQIGKEVGNCLDLMFDPSLVGEKTAGVHKMIQSSIEKCDVDLHSQTSL